MHVGADPMLTGVSMVRDEADIIEATCLHMFAEGADRLIVADNGSVDGTRDILHDLARQWPVDVIYDDDPAYWQSRKMTALARRVTEGWVIPFDADEVWYSPTVGTIADRLAGEPAGVVTARGFDHVRRAGDPDGHPYNTILHRRREPQRFPKVAFKASPIVEVAQGNHSVSHPGEWTVGLELRHFQYRSFDQFRRKVRQGKAAYDMTTLPQSEGAHWRYFGAKTDQQLFDDWTFMGLEADLVFDPAPIR
jgi:glycosyltransferase involved in cell wall biosynthesis